ncbi:MAG TPA: hypothetical protein VJ725_03735 [Thermoanaerobaculia bacterium]|nr:hypothetical protein [Thermoanaerobaculia bacterium]
MHTRATGRRSSSPVPASRQTPGAGRPAFAVPAARQPAEPPDYDAWLRNAEAFGHHFAELPAPASPPVQRKPDESASPYALSPGIPMNALRTSFGPEPIQGFGIPDWMKRLGRGVGGLASGAWNRVFGGGGNAQNQQLPLPPQDLPDPEPAAPPELGPAPLPAPAPAPVDDGVGLGPLPAPAPAAAPAAAAAAPEIVPPSWEELQRLHARWDAQSRRGPRGAAAAAEESSGSEDEGIDEDEIRATARANSDRLSGHGRQAHGRKGRSRPASQVASNTARSRRRAEEQTVAAAASRARRERESKDQ